MIVKRTLRRSRAGCLACLLCVLITAACRDGGDSLGPEIEIGPGFFTRFPLSRDNFYLFVNLGHLNPPGHTFPSDHGGFYLSDWTVPVGVIAPGDMEITAITRVDHVNKGYADYDVVLSANRKKFEVIFGHLSSLHPAIESAAPAWETADAEIYTTGGDTYSRRLLRVGIAVTAGDTIGTAGGNPGQFGLDFGVYDYTREIEFAGDRFDDYRYPHTVSPLDYFSEELTNLLLPLCGDYVNGRPEVRTAAPVGGTIDYDRPGTLSGLWFRQGEPSYPEDPHLALVRCNVHPGVSLISAGTSVPGLASGLYAFTPADTGTVNRRFELADEAGVLYRYEIYPYGRSFAGPEAVLLMRLETAERIQAELQPLAAGPPWLFTAAAVSFVR
ncbi:hypothetical protein JXO52_07355 [bacterium]|nr:hypothetical protein [bacterium]